MSSYASARAHQADHSKEKRQLRQLAHLLDEAFTIPGTRFRFGLDGLLGLIPGVGDAAGAAMSSFIIARAAQMGAPITVLLQMAFNVLLEMIIGVIPFLGDAFDFVWKANRRNITLLEKYVDNPRKVSRKSKLSIGAVATVLIVGLVALVVGAFFLIGLAVTAIF